MLLEAWKKLTHVLLRQNIWKIEIVTSGNTLKAGDLPN